MKDINHVIKHANFGDDRLRGSGVVAGQISAIPIDFAGRPYNTLTLPCERVIRERQGKQSIAVHKTTHRYGNSRAIWDHTVLPATRQR